MLQLKKFFKYSDEAHQAEVTLVEGPLKATGKARAHEDDLKYANKLTGLQIAEFRALIKFLDKRSKLKLKQVNRLRNDATFLEQSAKEDQDEMEELKEVVKLYIEQKDSFYKNLKNPPQRVAWSKLDEGMLSDSFKKHFESNLIEGEDLNGKTTD
jgi:hypothetical protein